MKAIDANNSIYSILVKKKHYLKLFSVTYFVQISKKKDRKKIKKKFTMYSIFRDVSDVLHPSPGYSSGFKKLIVFIHQTGIKQV